MVFGFIVLNFNVLEEVLYFYFMILVIGKGLDEGRFFKKFIG